jgi:hypothetical protein
MARFYSTFDESSVAALEAINADNAYQQVLMPTGAALKSALLTARSALSTQAYTVINAGNRDGALGIVVPNDVVTRVAGNYAWSNLYTNTGAVWPSDPRVRPTAPIVVAGSTPVSPTDAGTITESYYTDAQTAVENVLSGMTGGGPRARIGLTPYRTLASIWHDHEMTFFAWDDFTPGAVNNITASYLEIAGGISVDIGWDNYQFPNDSNPNARLQIQAQLDRQPNADQQYFLNYTVGGLGLLVPPLDPLKVPPWNVTPMAAGTYQLRVQIEVRDPVITTHFGASVVKIINNFVTIL